MRDPSYGSALSGPALREPDLPRTAKVRQQALRTGWTTGTCASAAAKAATALRDQAPQDVVEVALPSGCRVTFAVESCRYNEHRATAVVVKDAGDDPDVTHGAHLGDRALASGTRCRPRWGRGRRHRDRRRARRHLGAGRREDGPQDHERTLGILGGISILGTTGIVRPFSTAARRARLEQAVSVMAAQGERTVVLRTGGRTEKGALALFPTFAEVCFVEVGDFTGAAIRRALDVGIERVLFVGMAGKLAKLAAGVLMTHYTRSKVDLGILGDITTAAGGTPELAAEVMAANTGRHAYEIWERNGLLRTAGDELCQRVRAVLLRAGAGRLEADVAMVDFAGRAVVAASRPDWVGAA
ncbi:MAG: cobalt-precorrin-5B (C(1))-methyltransferase [Carbonactinosporaceae bacterium]